METNMINLAIVLACYGITFMIMNSKGPFFFLKYIKQNSIPVAKFFNCPFCVAVAFAAPATLGLLSFIDTTISWSISYILFNMFALGATSYLIDKVALLLEKELDNA